MGRHNSTSSSHVERRLAIKQASAYMARTGTTTSRYLDHYRSSDKNLIKLLRKDFGDRSRYSSIGNAVATTWLISFEQISRNPLAAQRSGRKAYAFITQRDGQDSFDIHRLVRLVMRNWLDDKGQVRECRVAVLRRLAEAFPFPKHENREVWMRYLPHAQAALEYGDDAAEAEVDLLFHMAASFSILGKYKEAEAMYRQTLELRQKVLGAEHPDTLASMNNLAHVLYSLGKYGEAEAMHRQTLELTEKVLGAEHPSTLTSMMNLANVLGSLGKYKEAEAIHRQTLNLSGKVLGVEHPSTLDSMKSLANVVNNLGMAEEAEAMHRQTLKLREKVLGAEHPDALASMNDLANILQRQGKYEEAEAMHRQDWKLTQKVLGAKHPSTLDSVNNLASVLQRQGKYEEAEASIGRIGS
ncbi:hypothetical protein GE09DRAFT_1256464 [Coniochaeta sp. 2T2.1]|nr:hypothetical protein GE09DRAFT_1256464 [Coniochaeta sp. 2T2.1]